MGEVVALAQKPNPFPLAAALIRKHGWGQGFFRNPHNGCYCIRGALSQVIHGTPYAADYGQMHAERLLDGHLGLAILDLSAAEHFEKVQSVIQDFPDRAPSARLALWNNMAGRTKEDVLVALETVKWPY
jgi:hypothetical protein